MAKYKSSASYIVIQSIFVIHLVNVAQFNQINDAIFHKQLLHILQLEFLMPFLEENNFQ